MASVYCPYNSDPRNLPMSIAEIAKITVDIAVPDISMKPPRAECSAILARSFDKPEITFTYAHLARAILSTKMKPLSTFVKCVCDFKESPVRVDFASG